MRATENSVMPYDHARTDPIANATSKTACTHRGRRRALEPRAGPELDELDSAMNGLHNFELDCGQSTELPASHFTTAN